MSDMPRASRRKHHDPKMIGLWKIGRTIGKGSSGRVRIARHSKTGQFAAVKIVSKQSLVNSRMSMTNLPEDAERILHGIEREIVIMKLIDHPNIMRLYDVWETSTELYLILEYVEGGELFDYLCNKGRLSTPEALSHFQQIMTAVNYCHRFNIAHRDLKPENVLLDANMNIKVADFGMAAWQGKSNLLRTACGSPHYAAPEVIMGEAYNGTSSDVWSCGVILYALLAGRLPFDDEDLGALLEKVKVGKFTMPADIDPKAQDLISKMLEKNVEKRIPVSEVLKHPFYTSRPPKAMDCDVPSLDEIARPLASVEDIDADILSNLRTLWPGITDERLKESLTNSDQSWEKGVYHLLVRYRAKHLENYDEEEDKLEEKRRLKQERKRKQRVRIAEDLPPRAGAPTPTRGQYDDDHSPGPSGPFRKLTSIGSEIFTSEIMELDPEELASPALAGPGVQDEKMQHFFHQIVEHLNIMQTSNRANRRQKSAPTPKVPARSPSPPPLTLDLGVPFSVRKNERERQNMPPPDEMDDTFSDFSTGNGTRPLSIRRRSEKENRYLTVQGNGQQGPWPERKSSLRSNNTGTSEGSSIRADRHIQIVEPTGGRLGKKRSLLRPRSVFGTGSNPGSPNSSAFSSSAGSSYFYNSTPNRNWLGQIFRLGPASYQLLSTSDAGVTRRVCKRILEGMGVSVMLIQAEGMGTLKCALEDRRDPAGVMGSVKGVKFRVEMKIPTTVQAVAGFTVAMNMVMEKGAHSSFKLVCSRLRREWDLDTAPVAIGSVNDKNTMMTDRIPQDERFVQVVYATSPQ